ncbi:MAG: tetraprenyl-beta-curcumene synthase family protein [Firmicutes bacterium]|jgi:tetraprenyl-beta-curcumene synthase|nr:tetraprenyl-beta-curcumene synthase family protein [Bacillota bacterium]
MIDSLLRLPLTLKMIKFVLPAVEKELHHWRKKLDHCPQELLQELALASIEKKRFHAQGGAVFSLYQTVYKKKINLIPPIVALQTISDYLDNLCDRAGCQDGDAFRQLHNAFLDALDPQRPTSSYYSSFPYEHDGGYLAALVQCCRRNLTSLPSYSQLVKKISTLAQLYVDLQVYKHITPLKRKKLLIKWFRTNGQNQQTLAWWEFAAASGSTLGIFMLFALAAAGETSSYSVEKHISVYFPWICGLHILLDYLIDQEEDRRTGDLNFVSFYPHLKQCASRLRYFLQQSLAGAASLPHPHFHLMIVKGLLALYLSDPKVEQQGLEQLAAELISFSGNDTWLLYRLCRLLRRQEMI